MSPVELSPVARAEKRTSRRLFLGVVSFVLGLLMIGMPKYLPGIDSVGLKTVVMLLPWVALALAFWLSRRVWREDELEVLINRRALAFAFYAAFFGVLALHHLQAAGFIPAIAWTTRGLVSGMALLLILGLVLSKLRYR